MTNRSTRVGRDLDPRGRSRPWRWAILCGLVAVLVATSLGHVASATGDLAPSWAILLVGLLGIVSGGDSAGSIEDLLGRIQRFQDGEDDVEFSTETDGDLGRLYDAVDDLAARLRRQERDDTEGETYRKELYRITSDTDLSPDEQMRELLALARDRLDVEAAFVSRIDEEAGRFEIVTADGSDLVQAGVETDLENAFCRRTITGEDVLEIRNAGAGEWEDDPAREFWGVESYLGGPIEIDGDLYGTVCFVDSEPRARAFTHEEKTFVDTIVRWVTYLYDRRVQQQRLGRYRQLVENSGDPMAVLDEAGRFEVINEALAEFHGESREALLGRYGGEVVDDEDAEHVESLIHELLADETRDSDQIELWLTDAEGTDHLFELNLRVLQDDEGAFEGTVATFRDVTERGERETELERTSELLRNAERLGDVGAWEIDVEAEEITWTEGTRRIHQVDGTFEPTIENSLEFYHPDDRDTLRELVERCLETGEPYQTELRIRTARGAERWVESRGERIAGHARQLRGYIQDVTERKELAEQLRQREQRLAEYKEYTDDILDAVPDTFYVRDREGNLVRYNERLPEVTGYSPAELEATEPLDLIAESDHETVNAAFETVFDTGSGRVEAAYETRDGERIPYEFAAVSLEDPDGEEVLAGIGRDISERKEREQALRETNERLNALIEASPDALVMLDLDGTVRRWNPAAERIFGWDEAEVLGEQNPIVPPGKDEEFAEFRERLAADETVRGIEFQRRTKDGSLIDVSLSAAPIHDSDGEIVGIMGVLEDISERKEAERRLQERERELAEYKEYTDDVLDAIDDVFYVLDADGNVERWNGSLARATGYGHDEIEEMHAQDFFDDAHQEVIADANEEVLETGQTRFEVPLLTKDGEQIPYEFVAVTLEDVDGNPVFTGIGRDISERVETERELSRLMSNVPGLVHRVENAPEWPTEFVSEGVRDVTGYDRETLESGDVTWGEDVIVEQEAVWEQVQQSLEDREAFRLTYPIETADGERRWVKEQGRGIFADDGSVEALEGVIIDVTERVEYEHELDRTRELLEQAQAIAGVGGWELDLTADPPEMTWTNELYRLHGLSRDVDLDLEKIVEQYHPEDREVIREQFQVSAETGEGYDMQVRLQPDDGDIRWIRALCVPVFEDGEVVKLRGSMQDITQEKRREWTLESLHQAARGLLQTDSDEAVAQLGVETADEILDPCGVGIYLLDSAAGELVPTAYTEGFERLTGGTPAVRVGDEKSPVWNSFATGRRQVFQDEGGNAQPGIFTEAVDGGLIVPIGDYGVFVAASRDGVGERSRRLAETLVATTEAAFDRLENEADLRDRDAELADRNRRLHRQVQLTNIIRRIDQSLVAATSRQEIETAVCEGLAEAEDVAFAWLGTVDPDGRLEPRTWAGDGGSYLDSVSLDVSNENGEPAVATADSGEPTVAANLVDDLGVADWQRLALEAGFTSALAVPVAYDEYRHGVLAVYADRADAFGDLERTVFVELGRTIANAINAVQTREALHADTLVEVDLRIEDGEGFLAQLARAADCEVEHVGLASDSAGGSRLVFAIADGTDVEEVLEDLLAVSEYRDLGERGDRRVYEALVSGATLPSTLLARGASPQSISATAENIEATVHVPASTDVREFVETLRESYPSVELAARRNVDRTTRTHEEMVTDLLDGLTARQLEVLRTAFYGGFFDWPRGSSGEEIAEMLDITQPTVSRHLRLGQKRLLEQLFESDVPTAVPTE